MPRFEFATATRIIFGNGAIREIGPIAAAMGDQALVVTGRSRARAAALVEALRAKGVGTVLLCVDGEPTTETVSQIVRQGREAGCNLVVGFGGGSAVDTGKAAAALLTNAGEPMDYLEVVGRGRAISMPPLPFIAIPTTAGSGAEVTRNAVLISPEHRVKVSLRSPLMLPRIALVDPELTITLPPEITAATGLDALTQVMEPFVSNSTNPMTDAVCREGLARGARSLYRAYERGNDLEAREDMALCSLFGGLALANGRLGAVHGFAGPIGGMCLGPHGAICAGLLPHVMAVNLRALKERDPGSDALSHYAETGRILTASPKATALDGLSWIEELCKTLRVPALAACGLRQEDFPDLIRKASAASSMQGNPVKLTHEEMEEILSRAM